MSSHAEANAKRELVKQLLEKNKLAPPNEIMEAVEKKFGSGIARTEISQMRLELHGVKFGPGGIVLNKRGPGRPRNAVRAKAKVEAAVGNGNTSVGRTDRLQKLVAQVREEMRELQLSALSIPMDGQVRAIATVQMEKTFDI